MRPPNKYKVRVREHGAARLGNSPLVRAPQDVRMDRQDITRKLRRQRPAGTHALHGDGWSGESPSREREPS
jgi:hypothetical protein